MSSPTLSAEVFNNLRMHLAELEDVKYRLIDECFPEPSKERNEFEVFMAEYIKSLNHLLAKSGKAIAPESNLPFVVIGSEVEIQDLNDQEVYQHHIVNPLKNSIKPGDVSFLSPVGKSLLLKRVGDVIEVKAPGGVFKYRIKAIRLPAYSDTAS